MSIIEEKAKERAEEIRQEKMPEAVASVSYDITTPNGYNVIFTMRGQSEASLFERMEGIETFMKESGYTPQIKRFAPKPQPLPLEGEKCPLCGSDVIKKSYKDKEGKDKFVIKCTTQKWDPIQKKQTGCSYTKFLD